MKKKTSSEFVASSQVEKLEECLMKTDKVNNETLLVKGSVQTRKKKAEKPRATRKNELLDNDLCKSKQ